MTAGRERPGERGGGMRDIASCHSSSQRSQRGTAATVTPGAAAGQRGMLPCCPARTPTVWTASSMARAMAERVRDGLDDLVDDADLDGLVDAAGDLLVLGGQLGLDLRPHVGGDLGQLAAVQDPDRGHRRPSRRPRRPARRTPWWRRASAEFIAM